MHPEGLSTATHLSPLDVGMCSEDDSAPVEKTIRMCQEEKTNRHPRWDKHETLLLVAAKRKQNEGIRDVGMRSRKFGSPDERWDLVSLFCNSNGVARNARECRRQWNNMFHGDYRRIRHWQKLNGVDSYWTMSKDTRKEHQLPLSFYREVYAEIEDFLGRKPSYAGAQAAGVDECATTDKDEHVLTETNQLVYDGLHDSSLPYSGVGGGEECVGSGDGPACRNKRKEVPLERDSLKEELAAALESSGKAIQAALTDKVRAQIEAENYNSELDRSQRREHGDSILTVLGSLACALGRIADKF